MADYRTMYDSEWLHEYDLSKDEVTVEIATVEAATLMTTGGRKSKKPAVRFKGADKALALNKTNGKAIAQLYGTDVAEWPGKKVTLFRSTTEMAGETVRCIRIKRPI